MSSPIRVPGLTETYGDPCEVVPYQPKMTGVKPLAERDVILLSTATITEENIYMNGLFQNVFVLYRMFDAMGYTPIFIINEKPKQLATIPEPLRKCRMVLTEEVIRQPMPNVVALFEIGMSMDPLVRQFVKMIGGKLFKLYLGNILNIDVETPIFVTHHNFAHHVVGENDRILVSPHYGQHAEYASCLNHVSPPEDLKDMIAPYVWDSNILTRDGRLHVQWKAPAKPEDEVLVIMEPNISFQKASIIPLLLAERWYRDSGKARGWKGKVVVINGMRLTLIPYYEANVAPYLELIKDGRVEYIERMDILTTLRTWPSATFVLHNYNNEYNYMTMELLYSGFPALHNSPSWKNYGYYYEAADLAGGAAELTAIFKHHRDRLETYRAHAEAIQWRHSPYNPDNQAAWEKILKG